MYSQFYFLKVKILGALPFNPWAALTKRLHLGAPQKLHEK